MQHANADIRRLADSRNIHFWRIAARIGVSEPTFTRWLRFELMDERKVQVISAINELAGEDAHDTCRDN